MHLKNFSLYSKEYGKYLLTPAYDMLSTALVMPDDTEELALTLNAKKRKIKKEDFIRDKNMIKSILNISIPTTASRLIGSFIYFLEPIILTNSLKYAGYSSDFITLEYGILNGYVYPLLLLPSFFTLAISSAILPVVSNSYSKRNYSHTKSKIKQAIFFSLLIGIPCTLIFIFVPDIPLNLVYNTNLGINYIPYIAPFFLLHYIQAPLTSSLNGMGYSKEAMKGTLYGGIIKIISLVILSLLKIGLWSLPISSILNILVVTIHHIYYVNKYLKDKK
jgi:stage V sporulation protein B